MNLMFDDCDSSVMLAMFGKNLEMNVNGSE